MAPQAEYIGPENKLTTIIEEEDEEEDLTELCDVAATNLAEVILIMDRLNGLEMLFSNMVHSYSCRIDSCNLLCGMFKQVRHHATINAHICKLTTFYSSLLAIHAEMCVNKHCGLNCNKNEQEIN